ncbi:MAG: hypothetical protein ACM3MN_08010, partial [Nitrospirota bacterium]
MTLRDNRLSGIRHARGRQQENRPGFRDGRSLSTTPLAMCLPLSRRSTAEFDNSQNVPTDEAHVIQDTQKNGRGLG